MVRKCKGSVRCGGKPMHSAQQKHIRGRCSL